MSAYDQSDQLPPSIGLLAAFAWRTVEAGAKRLVEVGQVVEAPAIGDLGNAQRILILVAQRVAAGVEAAVEHPVAKTPADQLEPRMQGAHRNARVIRGALRRQFGVVQVLPAIGQ